MVATSIATIYNKGTIFTEIETPRSYIHTYIVAMDQPVQVCFMQYVL